MVWKDIKYSREKYGSSIAYFGNLATPLKALCDKVGIELPSDMELEKGKLIPRANDPTLVDAVRLYLEWADTVKGPEGPITKRLRAALAASTGEKP